MKLPQTLLLIAGFLFFTSCSSDDSADTTPIPDADVTYDGNVAAIISANCFNCHDSPVANGAPMQLTTFAEVVDAVNNRGLVARINSTTNPMPQTGLMSTANRAVIDEWVLDGLLEN